MKTNFVIYPHNTKVFDSWKLTDKEIKWVVNEIIRERKRVGYIVTRDVQSYYNEIIGHNRLYKLHLFRKHTKDTDLEEPTTKFKEAAFKILSIKK